MIYEFKDIKHDVYVSLNIEKIDDTQISVKYNSIRIPIKLRGIYRTKIAMLNIKEVYISSEAYPAIYPHAESICFCISGTNTDNKFEKNLSLTKKIINKNHLKMICLLFKPKSNYNTLEIL